MELATYSGDAASAEIPDVHEHASTELDRRASEHSQQKRHASAEALQADGTSWQNRRADALALMAETLLVRGPEGLRGNDKYLVHVHVDLAALRGRETEGASEVQGGPPLPIDTVRRLCCESSLVTWLEDASGRTLDVGRKTRAIAPALRRALDKRDQGCRFPGCTNRRFVDAHHIEHWADGGETKLENLMLVCRYHHRLLHEGTFQFLARATRCALRTRPAVRSPLRIRPPSC